MNTAQFSKNKNMLLVALTVCIGACSSGHSGASFSSGAYADAYAIKEPIQCVPYARKVSGIPIYGDAHTWWYQAANKYARGNRPQEGAVLVLSKSNRLRYGHLAVVKRVVGPRDIDITHSNWGSDRKTRSVVYNSMRVRDISPNNDWTRLKFWNAYTNAFGSPYPAHGFIYK